MTRSALKFGSSLALVAPLLLGAATSTNAAVTISNGVTANMTCAGGVCSATAADAVLNAKDLKTLLQTGSVTVESGSVSQDIVVAAPLKWTSGITLTLDAFHSLTISNALTVNGSGGLTILTNDGGSGGVFSIGAPGHVTFASVSSPLTINGQAYMLANSVAMLVGNINANPHGYHALANSYDAAHDGRYRSAPVFVLNVMFEGLGNTVSNIKIKANKESRAGFFSEVFGIVQHFNLANATVENLNETQNSVGCGGLAVNTDGATLFQDSVTGTVTGGRNDGVGGLVGTSIGGTISQSYSAAAVTGGPKSSIGSLVGRDFGAISDSYATGPVVIGTGGYGGGLVGARGCDGSFCGALNDVYSSGVVSRNSTGTLGGLLGDDLIDGGVANTYWDTTTSGVNNLKQGAGNVANDPGITGLTTAQLQAGLPAGFDPTIWAEDPNINGGLPYLRDLPPQ